MELTDDLIIEIFSRVPVKDLLRSTCVSKSWSSLIYTDPHLSRLQFHRTASKHRPFLVIQKSSNYRIDLESIDDENAKLEEIHNPFDEDDGCPGRVVGSCRGLLVLQHLPTLKIVVLNPTTNKYHLVPPNPAGDDNVVVKGFGYDQVHGCYKLVTRVKPTSMDDHAVELMIYDVNNGTWRKSKFDDLDSDKYYSSIHLYSEGIHVDGALYWCNDLGTRDTEAMKIIRFVLAEEEFQEVEPPNIGEFIMYNPNMTVFGGWLCLAYEDYSKPDSYYYTMEFWLMVAERHLGSSYPRRWTNFLSIRHPESLLPYHFTDPSLILICFSANGNKILFYVEGLQLFWYDVGKNEFTKLNNQDCCTIGVTCCVRSLIGNGIF